MERQSIKDKIIATFPNLNGDNWGKVLNFIQEIALHKLSKKSVDEYLKRSNEDSDECEGMDGILLNNYYFDWREFSYKAKEIVSAYLDYFSTTDLQTISQFC